MSTSKIIEGMGGIEIGERFLDQLSDRQLNFMLCYIHGYRPAAFQRALKAVGIVCGLQADDDNWCILPAGHAGTTHDAGEFTWDVWPEPALPI